MKRALTVFPVLFLFGTLLISKSVFAAAEDQLTGQKLRLHQLKQEILEHQAAGLPCANFFEHDPGLLRNPGQSLDVCAVECPAGAFVSPEPDCYDGYEDIYNGGCYSATGAPQFEDIQCGSWICGTSGQYMDGGVPYDDQDWYRLIVTAEASHISIKVVADGEGLIALFTPGAQGCFDMSETFFDFVNVCDTVYYDAQLLPGEYWVEVSLGFGAPCGSHYVMRVDCSGDDPNVCECPDDNLHLSTQPNLPIPDNTLADNCTAAGGISSTITLPPSAELVADVNVDVNILHTWVGDLAISLEHNGKSVSLKNRPVLLGPSCDNLLTTFDDEGLPWPENDCPHDGCKQTYNPAGCPFYLLSEFDGMPIAGDWIIHVADGFNGDDGTLLAWGLCIAKEEPPCAPDPLVAEFDPADGIPQAQCLFLCPDIWTELIVGPGLSAQQEPALYLRDGCVSVPGVISCDNPDCNPPEDIDYTGWSYNPANGTWSRLFRTDPGTPPGCICVILERILPVELTSFDAVPGDRSITLYWSTASETDNDHFDIIRNETVVGRVDAANSTSGYDYTWTEANLTNGREYSYRLLSVDMSGYGEELGIVSATPAFTAAAITEYALLQNYPNPFNPSTTITFDLVEAGHTKVIVYNTVGQTAAVLVDGALTAGRHTIDFNAAALPSGLYFYRMEAGDFSAVKKMILMK